MGATAEDTGREIAGLRDDATAAFQEIQRRFGGGVQGIAAGDARVAGLRAGEDLARRAAESSRLTGVAGTVAVAGVAYGIYRLVARWRESRRPKHRLKQRAGEARAEIEERLQEGREQVEQLRRRGLVLKVGGETDGIHITDARGQPLAREKGSRSDVVKKLLWAAMLALFMAGSGVLARRLAGDVWRATIREEPPTQKR